jgi:hypothetical protein
MITILGLVIYLATAMSAWVPMANHSYYEKLEMTQVRYSEIATTIAAAVLDGNQVPIFNDEDDLTNRVKTGLLLASIAAYESSFKKEVDSCAEGGDHGLAWGIWQTHANKTKVCADRSVAVRVALGMIETSFNNCKNRNISDRLSIYTDGICHTNWKRSRNRVERALSWHKKHRAELLVNNETSE